MNTSAGTYQDSFQFLVFLDMLGKHKYSEYDKLWASVMKAVPKLDESESGQMVLK